MSRGFLLARVKHSNVRYWHLAGNVRFGLSADVRTRNMLDLKREKVLACPVKHAPATPYTHNELLQNSVLAEYYGGWRGQNSTIMHRPNCFLGAIARAPRRPVIAVSKQQPMQFGLRSRSSRSCCYWALASRLTNSVSTIRIFRRSTRASNIRSKKGASREYKEANSWDERADS